MSRFDEAIAELKRHREARENEELYNHNLTEALKEVKIVGKGRMDMWAVVSAIIKAAAYNHAVREEDLIDKIVKGE